MATRDHNDNPLTAVNHELYAKRRAFADAYYARLKDAPDYTRKRVTLAMLRDILEHMVFPIVGLSLEQNDPARDHEYKSAEILKAFEAIFPRQQEAFEKAAQRLINDMPRLKELTDEAFAADEEIMRRLKNV